MAMSETTKVVLIAGGAAAAFLFWQRNQAALAAATGAASPEPAKPSRWDSFMTGLTGVLNGGKSLYDAYKGDEEEKAAAKSADPWDLSRTVSGSGNMLRITSNYADDLRAGAVNGSALGVDALGLDKTLGRGQAPAGIGTYKKSQRALMRLP